MSNFAIKCGGGGGGGAFTLHPVPAPTVCFDQCKLRENIKICKTLKSDGRAFRV